MLAPTRYEPNMNQLPTELLYKVIAWVVADSIHSICLSPEDTTWEMTAVQTLHSVSPIWGEITLDVVINGFDIPKQNSSNDVNNPLASVEQVFECLNNIGRQLQHPSAWGGVNFKEMDCCLSSLVFAYALYMSCVALRRNAIRSSPEVFESTHQIIMPAIAQSHALCERVKPIELGLQLWANIVDEYALSTTGFTIGRSFREMEVVIDVMTFDLDNLPSGEDRDEGLQESQDAVYELLEKILKAEMEYTQNAAKRLAEPPAYNIPGVLPILQKLRHLIFRLDEVKFRSLFYTLADRWTGSCPYLNQTEQATQETNTEVTQDP